MITTGNKEIRCTGLDLNGNKCSFTILILEKHEKHWIVKKGKRLKLIYNKIERSLRKQTTGELLFIHVRKD